MTCTFDVCDTDDNRNFFEKWHKLLVAGDNNNDRTGAIFCCKELLLAIFHRIKSNCNRDHEIMSDKKGRPSGRGKKDVPSFSNVNTTS